MVDLSRGGGAAPLLLMFLASNACCSASNRKFKLRLNNVPYLLSYGYSFFDDFDLVILGVIYILYYCPCDALLAWRTFLRLT